MYEKPVHCDAIVTYGDAERWAAELYARPPAELEAELVQLEPALVAVATNLAGRLHKRLLSAGVEESFAAEIATYTTRAGVICAELARRGFRKFHEPPADEEGKS